MEISSKRKTKQTACDELAAPPDNVLEEGRLEGLVDKVLGKKLADAAELQMNHTVMGLLDEYADQEKEKAKDRQADSAEFSNDSLAYNRSGKEMSQKELELLLDRLWALLEAWQPQPESGLLQEIIQLKELYQLLLEKILDFYTKDQAWMQADRINRLLLHIIDTMGKAKFPNLLHLLEEYGEEERADFLRASVMEKITGKTVSPQDIAAAREREMDGKESGGTRHEEGRSHGGPYPGGKNRGQRGAGFPDGVLYSKGAGKGIYTNRRYMEQVWEAERFTLPSAGKNRKTEPGSGLFPFQGKLYSVSDIERGERFVRYMSEKGNLYYNPALTARNEELLGFLMAVSMEKVRIFGEYAGVGDRMVMDVDNGLERFLRHCLFKSTAGSGSWGTRAGARPDIRLVQRMYYRVMEIIQRMKTPGKGLEKGLKYAYESFMSGKDTGEHNSPGREPGFFGGCGDLHDNGKELKYGAKVLDEDWKEFLSSIGQDNIGFLQMALLNCPWGAAMDGEKPPENSRKPGPAVFLILAGAVAGYLLVRFVY